VATEKSERAKAEALAGYLDPGPKHLNCAQAVMLGGLVAMDQDPDLTSVAGYLGGGMARMGQVCGALSGAAVTLGLRDRLVGQIRPKNLGTTFDALQQMFREFESEFGALTCGDLLGCDISSSEGFREAKRGALTRCPEYVGWACDRLIEMFERDASEGSRGI
jgi:C_GCAxxG_C_C family probable redox protein